MLIFDVVSVPITVDFSQTINEMVKRCVVRGCGNSNLSGHSTHTFPKNAVLRQKWENFVKKTRADWNQATEFSVICGAHFVAPDDFEGYMQWEMGFKRQLDLKARAVPSKNQKLRTTPNTSSGNGQPCAEASSDGPLPDSNKSSVFDRPPRKRRRTETAHRKLNVPRDQCETKQDEDYKILKSNAKPIMASSYGKEHQLSHNWYSGVAEVSHLVQRKCDEHSNASTLVFEGDAEKSKKRGDADSPMDLGCIKEEADDLINILFCSNEEIEPEESVVIKEEPIEHTEDTLWIKEDENTLFVRVNIPDTQVVPTELRDREDCVMSENIIDKIHAEKSKKGCDADSAMDFGCIKEEADDLTNKLFCSNEEIDPEDSGILKEGPIELQEDLSRTEEEENTDSSRLKFPELRVVLTRLRGIEDFLKSGNIMDLSNEKVVKMEIKDEPLESENQDFAKEHLADHRKEANVLKDRFVKRKLLDQEKKRDADSVGVPRPPRSRRHESNVMSWKKYAAKALRDAGQAYTSRANGKFVPAKKIGNPCRDGCFDKITWPVIQELFDDFWGICDFDKQNAYIRPLVYSKPVKRRRKPPGDEPPVRTQTLEYTVTYRNDVYAVCKLGFLAIFGISESRVRTALRKVTATGTTVPDKRGKHRPATKKDRRVFELIGEHVGSIPKVSSQYTRAKSPNRKYLASELNMCKLYKLYRSWMSENYPSDEVVNEGYYRFVITSFNISFAPVKMCMCTTCDLFNTQLACKRAENAAQADLQEIESALEEHRNLAKQGQEIVAHFRRGKYDQPNTLALCFDFQQTLLTPKLSHDAAYYKRKMWTYNFCVTNIKTRKSTMFIWHEVSGKRGSVEVASCLLKYLELHHYSEKKTNLFLVSDSCASQNKNINLSLVLLRLIHERKFYEINHICLVPCHSHMPCNRHFYFMESKLKKFATVETKHDYIALIKEAIPTGVEVVDMDTKDFLNVDVLMKSIPKRTPQEMKFSDARIVQYSFRFCEGYSVKDSYSDKEEFKKVSLIEGLAKESTPQDFNLSNVTLRPKYSGPIRLKAAKVKHLKDLVPFISRDNVPYYQDILAQQEAAARQGPEDISDEEESDANDNLMEYE